MAVHDMLMAAAGGTAGAVNYVDDVFSTYLYTGNSSTQTITNGIDLSTKGGLVWTKMRQDFARDNFLVDTARGVKKFLYSNSTSSQNTASSTEGLSSFNTDGYSLTSDGLGLSNDNNGQYVSWTFRKQAKFFDVVTYTGNGVANRSISHSLGSVPGCIIIKATSSTQNWCVWHIKSGITNSAQGLSLNTSDASTYPSNDVTGQITSTSFNLEWITDYAGNAPNSNGVTYVAYVFGNNAGGFGAAGTDNVISCGSYTGNGSSTGPTVTLGYEPQWLLIKRTNAAASWYLMDVMRGMPVSNGTQILMPNASDAEINENTIAAPLSTGFQIKDSSAIVNASGSTYIYIAIRRPMKPPTSGTSVFQPVSASVTQDATLTTNIATDLMLMQWGSGGESWSWEDRLRGFAPLSTSSSKTLYSDNAIAEITTASASLYTYSLWNTTAKYGPYYNGATAYNWAFRRASTFFDIVCYTGTGSATTQNHNLGVAPELMIVKKRNSSSVSNWMVYAQPLGATKTLVLNATDASTTYTAWNNTAPTSTVFSIDTNYTNQSGDTFVAYLFATVAGVSKVGSYTGTGTTQQINCGFTSGARFVMIKRTDSTGGWYVWDSARGIVSGNDPYLLINSTAAQVTNTDYVDPYSAGFEISSTAPAAINASGGTYIYLAIA